MAEKVPQTFANHTRLDPPFHFFIVPVAAINVVVVTWNLIQNFSYGQAWLLVLSIAGVVAVLKFRLYALKVQDRVIRLEERLRLGQLLPDKLRGRIPELDGAQLIALRFACDEEVPRLCEKALAGKMSRKDIKKAIVTWRPDYNRV